jgi:hypothetical protein
LFAHDLFRKSLHPFRDHAPGLFPEDELAARLSAAIRRANIGERMRAETQKLVEEIKQSVELLRRSL